MLVVVACVLLALTLPTRLKVLETGFTGLPLANEREVEEAVAPVAPAEAAVEDDGAFVLVLLLLEVVDLDLSD